MKKKIAILGLFAALITSVSAQDLVIPMTEAGGVEIINNGRFDIVNKCLGNTITGTTISLGEIDFADGSKYAACGAEFAHESKSVLGMLDFYLGDPDNGGIKITDVEVKGTGAFQFYRTFRFNFYPEGTDGFTYPKGKGKVYLRYNGCEGNLKKVIFYQQSFNEEEMGEMPDPQYTSLKLGTNVGTVVNSEQHPETKPNADGAWGWTGAGLIVKYSQVDFKDGNLYKQIGVVSTHGGSTNPDGFLEIYIDDVNNESNLIAKIWTARDWQWSIYAMLAKNLTQNISGVHDIYVKWTGATNLKEVHLIEGTPWAEEDDAPEKVEIIDEPISDKAYGMHFDSMGGIENVVEFMAKGSDDLKFEPTNIGYTSNGVVLKFVDVDFKDGLFTRILVNHSSDQTVLPKSNFDFYLDLNHANYDDLSVLKDDVKLATVKAQGTNNWGTPKRMAGAMLSSVTGVHNLYMVFDTEAGINVHGVYLDTDYTSSIGSSPIEGVTLYSVVGSICVESTDSIEIAVCDVQGKTICQTQATSGLTTLSMTKGLYLVKIVDGKGNVSTNKVVVQ